jgi:soluble lytic murein transglycosylase-like protein
MDDASRRRRTAGYQMARRAVALTMAACLLVSCTEEPPEGVSAGDRTSEPDRRARGSQSTPDEAAGRSRSPAPQTTPEKGPGELPTFPATRDAATLADQLDRAAATLRQRDAPATDVRRAAELQQLAIRALATASGPFRRKVTTHLHPETAVVTRGGIRAARSLHSLTAPEKKLPRWRIVAPPPPGELLGYYREAQRRIGVPWTYLAAIHLVETRMGRIRGVSSAGALGPMQFLPSTWELYGAGGDIKDPRDAILAAARLLKANGAPGDMADALWHYNPSTDYVRAVSEYARTMQRSRTAYRGYWHWRVLYRHTRGTYVLPVGYPDTPAVLLRGR